MATLVVTFNFATTAESFSATEGSGVTLTHITSDGNPSGSLQSALATKNRTSSSDWARTLTWEDMGVPSGSLITGVTGASCDFKCTAATAIGTNTAGNVDLVDGANTIVLSAAATFTTTHGSWQTSTGTDATGLSLDSGNSVDITINNILDTNNTNGANVTLLQDVLTFTITYDAPVPQVVSGSLGEVDVTGYAGDYELGAEFIGSHATINVLGYTSALELGQVLQGTMGNVSVLGYAGTVQIVDPIIARIDDALNLQIAGELTEDAVATKKFYDKDGNLELNELTEGSTFFMDENNNLTVFTFEELATLS